MDKIMNMYLKLKKHHDLNASDIIYLINFNNRYRSSVNLIIQSNDKLDKEMLLGLLILQLNRDGY